MRELLLLIFIFFFAVAFYVIYNKLKATTFTLRQSTYTKDCIFKKALSVLLFLLYMPHLFTLEVISDQIGLANGMFSPLVTILLLVLKWLTYLSVAVCVLLPFFDKKEASDYSATIMVVVAVLNCIFFKPIIITILGTYDAYHYKTIIYAVIIVLLGAIAVSNLMIVISNKDYSFYKSRFLKLLLFVAFYLMAFMPTYAPQLLFGIVGEESKSFTLTHRLLIYLSFLFPLSVYFLMRKKSYEQKRYMLMMLALSGFMQYFYYNAHREGLNTFPLHLCNTAIALMFFAFMFNIKSVFYFTYLVNVMGALCAILMPSCDYEFFLLKNIGFWYNHIYAFVLPVLAVALKVFDRPTLKLMKKAIIAFSFYVLFAATFNGWLNNSPINVNHTKIDYFFLYSDFFIDKFPWAFNIKYDFILKFWLGDTQMVFYYLYNFVIYIIFIALMFVAWGLYGITYKVGDAHQELLRRKKLIRIDKLNLLKQLNGRKLNEPLNLEGVNMIKINNFSKTYTGSNKKAVNNISLEIHDGEVFGFIGHNGAGKSTTIKSMVGIQTISEGSIEIQGFDIAKQPLEAKLNIGYVSDTHAVYEKLTGREYVNYVADLYLVNEKDRNERLERYATKFNLINDLDKEIKSYSLGMKQKLMVISALIHNPKVWILDEPLTGLDPTSSFQIKSCMREHADAGNIVFFSSHVIEVVEKICDKIAIICDGEICKVAPMEEILKEEDSLEKVYLKYTSKSHTQPEAIIG